jgi:hypothetical protein
MKEQSLAAQGTSKWALDQEHGIFCKRIKIIDTQHLPEEAR